MILKNIKNIICATTSPRRIHLLQESFTDIKFITPSYKEKPRRYFLSPVLLSIYNAFRKIRDIKCNDNDAVLGFDTIVYRKFKIHDKPKNREHAVKCIKELNNKTHKVVTGICIKYNKKTRFYYEISKVRFKKLSDKKIMDYIATGEWRDKAGGYGIQGAGGDLVQWYKGDYYNIVGLPLDPVLKLFKKK